MMNLNRIKTVIINLIKDYFSKNKSVFDELKRDNDDNYNLQESMKYAKEMNLKSDVNFDKCFDESSHRLKLGTNKNCCNKLMCTKCDIDVKIFIGFYWENNVDYIFFRSYYDDIDKLKLKLIKSANHISYSCQCQWLTLNEEEKNMDNVNLSWFCLGHSYY